MSIRRNVVTAVVAALIASGGLAGCSDGEADEPPDSGLPSKSELSESTPTSPATGTTPTEPSGPTPPELPEAAKRDNKAGAQAFVAYYLELLDYATVTGDVAPLLRHSNQSCAGCKDDAEFYRKLYDRGGWAKGLDRRLKEVLGASPARPEDIYVGVVMIRSKGTYRLRRDAKIQTLKAEASRLDFYLSRNQNGWTMARVERPA